MLVLKHKIELWVLKMILLVVFGVLGVVAVLDVELIVAKPMGIEKLKQIYLCSSYKIDRKIKQYVNTTGWYYTFYALILRKIKAFLVDIVRTNTSLLLRRVCTCTCSCPCLRRVYSPKR